MQQIGDGVYRCTACGSVLQVDVAARPVAMLAAQSGQANERVVTVGNVEIHRCSLAIDLEQVAVAR